MTLHSRATGFARTLTGGLAAVVTVLAMVAAPAPAGAQTSPAAPAGNAHPTDALLATGEATNPFQPMAPTAFASPEEKKAFADQVDLSPLRDLAVFHNNRVKILDTLAREGVSAITGRRNYRDAMVDPETGDAEAIGYDPLFTLLDLMIDPVYYLDKPLVHVEYLPLREDFLDAAFGPDETGDDYQFWKRQGRLPPELIARYVGPIAERRTFDDPFRRDLHNIGNAMSLYREGWRNLVMVAPPSDAQTWRHVSEAPADSGVAEALRQLKTAWRAKDAPGVNAAAESLASALPAINPEMYPTSRRSIEAAYNRAKPFEWGYWLYGFALLALLLAFGTGRRWLVWTGLAFLTGAVAMHAFGFTARCIIAERFAIQNQYESMTGLSLFATLVGIGVMVFRKQWLFGAAAAGVGFMVLLTATQTGIPGSTIEREAAILNTSWLLKYHVTTVLTSYGLISLGFMISLFYLGTWYASRARSSAPAPAAAGGPGGIPESPPATRHDADVFTATSAAALGLEEGDQRGVQRILKDLDSAQMIVLQLAFWVLGVGVLLGAWWADHSWGRWWAFDPKELWALITWIIYLIVIHVRFTTGRRRGLVTAWLSVLGFVVMLWTYFGVNLLLPGLHAYA